MANKKPIDIKTNDHYYARRRPQAQLGLFRLFCLKYKVPVESLIDCIETYRIERQAPHQPWSKELTLDSISAHFEEFLAIVKAKTGVEVGKKVERKSYSDYWQESNLDGSFAYNGVTDDF